MRCEICFHESTLYDLVSLRNLCEHLYLDALVRKNDLTHQLLKKKQSEAVYSVT
ncbi:MAG: hypothetical protein AB7T38_13805 [Nitrospirales bacterium]